MFFHPVRKRVQIVETGPFPSCSKPFNSESSNANRRGLILWQTSREEDYTIGGELTDFAVEELLSLGRVDELTELLGSYNLHMDITTSTTTTNNNISDLIGR